MIKLLNLLYEGADAPISQRFANKLIINGKDVYAAYNLKGHNGIDFAIINGTTLYSCINGRVIEAQFDAGGYGNYVKIENDSCGVLYAHLEDFGVSAGEEVKAGQAIGHSNNTGNSTGPHLHFGVFPKPRNRANGYAGYIDPLDPNQVAWVDDLVTPTPEEDVATLRKKVENLQLLLDQANTKIKDLQKQDLLEDDKLRGAVKIIEEVTGS
jgi:murein DD-endopeptidase MepM/ murein hydrolase activator NlpD